jgi:pyridoxamine 5'-phosphate oxidase
MADMARRHHPSWAEDLDGTLAEAFRLLSRGVADRRSPFHTPCLGTIGADGVPMLRTVVLRGVEVMERRLRIHTDLRSAKVGEIRACGAVAVHGYDPAAQVQLRLSGIATLHADDGVADAAWAASRPFSRRCYAIADAPGTACAAPPSAPGDEASGRGNFAALIVAFDRLEWLWLCAEGHRRARFSWQADGALSATWLVP